jgi:hypothetical protein
MKLVMEDRLYSLNRKMGSCVSHSSVFCRSWVQIPVRRPDITTEVSRVTPKSLREQNRGFSLHPCHVIIYFEEHGLLGLAKKIQDDIALYFCSYIGDRSKIFL